MKGKERENKKRKNKFETPKLNQGLKNLYCKMYPYTCMHTATEKLKATTKPKTKKILAFPYTLTLFNTHSSLGTYNEWSHHFHHQLYNYHYQTIQLI